MLRSCVRTLCRLPPRQHRQHTSTRNFSEVFPELMPVNVGELTRTKIEKLVGRCGFRPLWQIFEERMEAGNVTAQQCLLMLKKSDPEAAKRLKEELVKFGALDGEALTLYLSRLCTDTAVNAERWSDMKTIFDTMERDGPAPTANTFAAMVEAAWILETKIEGKAESKMSEDYVNRMFQSCDNLSLRAWGILFKIALLSRKYDRVEELYRMLLRRNQKMTTPLYELVITARLEDGRLEDAARLHIHLRKVNNGRLTHNVLERTIDVYLEKQMYSEAIAFFQAAKITGLEPGESVYKLLAPVVKEKGSRIFLHELDDSYRWNVLKEGVYEEEQRQAKLKQHLIRTLKYAGERSLKRTKRFRLPPDDNNLKVDKIGLVKPSDHRRDLR